MQRLAAAATQWPTLTAPPDDLAAGLTVLAAQHQLALDAVDAAEVYLFVAWQGNPEAAIAAFAAKYRSLIGAVAARVGLNPNDHNDIVSVLMQRLFVGDAQQPGKFASYVGRGQLGGLVRVAATRLALTMVAGKDRNAAELSAHTPVDERGIADRLAKVELQALLKRALEQSAGALTERQRAILRMHYVKQASIDDIAAVYRVHRATAARWLLDARAALVDTAREKFLLCAALEQQELVEVASLIESQLSMSWSRLFVDVARPT